MEMMRKICRDAFQFPPPRGGEQIFIREEETGWKFQFPPPRGGEPEAKIFPRLEADFNSRPREGANPNGLWRNFAGIHFNSRPREGANTTVDNGVIRIPISIPAPARGRTIEDLMKQVHEAISIPAPARGRTMGRSNIYQPKNFNSRPREGANFSRRRVFRQRFFDFNSRPREGANGAGTQTHSVEEISIPAPARGRTSMMHICPGITQFQFPPPRGGEQQNCTK